jgi:hypothetical protein
MRYAMSLVATFVTACSFTPTTLPVGTDPGETGSGSGSGSGSNVEAIPDVQCAGTPDAGPATDFNHTSSEIIAALGDPTHRGFDLLSPASATAQVIAGKIGYTIADKSLEDEDVDVFACRTGAWQKLGTARTDNEGGFALTLEGADRLPIGIRDMYVSVVGDRSGTTFLAVVAPDDTKLIASDVDGTLTESENAFTQSLVLGGDVGVQPGAPEAFAAAWAKHLIPVYVTARGNRFTDDTRQWLAANHFPRGPLHLAPSFITLPGGDTIDYKTGALQSLGFEIAAGVGNRETDITAYSNAGLPAERIFIKLPEYQSELAADLAANMGVGFATYEELRTAHIAGM